VSRNSYGNISYGKTATVLETLEVIIGKETLRRALHTYYDRYRFTHPTAEDFLKTVEEVSGQNLRWYFDQAVYGTQVLDYEVLRADSDRVDWFATKPPKAKKGETEYRTTVVVHRKGDFIFPVALAVRFDNGETVREHWDGRDRWARFTYDKKAKLVSAEIDPEHKVLLDKDLFNNSRLAEPETGAKRKLAGYWMLFTQYFAQLLAWLA
jgi:aminopeptidase N